jgi:glycosyltransferase involved in cell wall biosynthesis
MAPRKVKTIEPVKETPVVFFLRISESSTDSVIPVGESTSYADILHNVEFTRNEQRFNNELLKPILENIQREKTYSEHTACFWCCHPFDGPAYVLPISYDTYKNVYICEGNFSSPECALSYLYSLQTMSDGIRWNRHTLLFNLYSSLYKDPISPALPRTLLRMFGGPLDIKQYREYIHETGDVVLSDLPPIRMIFPSMNIQGPIRDIKKYVLLSNDVVEKASESLRLKRSKPVHVSVPTLDMCIQSKH